MEPQIVTQEWLDAHPESALPIGALILNEGTGNVSYGSSNPETQRGTSVISQQQGAQAGTGAGVVPPPAPVAAVDEIKAPLEPEQDPNGEPRARYRGHIVLIDGEREVNGHMFHHIRCTDGCEYDLTDKEYATEVKVSFPSEKI